MKRNSFLVVLLLFALAFLFVGCKKEEEPEPNPILVVGNIELQTEEGKTVKINAAIANVEDEEEEYELEFSSSDPTIAEVDANGNVDAKKAGEATITVSIKDFEDQKTEVKVIVLAKPTPPGKEIIEEFIPESIDIMGFVSMEVGASEKFMAMVKPASAYQVLVWSTSDPSIATVDNEGNVTAHSFGTVTITAHSAIAPDVKDSFEVVVKETGEDHEIAKKAFDYILERIPKYVTESFDLPVYPNPDVTITWKDASGTVLADNRYVYNEDITEDTTDAVICLIEYGFATREESVALKVVADPEKNNFANIELISLYLDILFADYIADSVNGDLPLPTALKGATLVWSTTKSDVITKTGEFTKPNNDTPVRLTALVTSGPIAQTFNFDLVAKGYTQQEKVDYSLTEGVLKPLVGLRSNANITLPSFEPRFGLTITWESANKDVFDSNGVYMERDLEKDTEVTFIATFKEGDTVFDVTAEVTVTALAATDVSKAVYDFVRNGEILAAIPTYFPFGLPGRESGNEIVGLPTSMEDHDGVTIEWEGNPEDFDGLVLKTQYLRYHETYLTATFSKEGVEPSTLKFLLNTGIAERDDSVNIGGRFSEQKVKDGFIEWDLLSTFSFWDKPVGEQNYKTQQYWSFWSGYTWYIDAETDRTSTLEQVEPGEGKRYQYFAMDFVTVYIMDVDANGKVTDWEYGNLREKTGGNWGVFFVNLSGKAAKIPLATHGAGNGTDELPWVSQGARENALTFDGYRKGFVTDETGKVIIGSGFGTLQDVLPSTTREIEIPVGGYGMSFKTQENLPIVGVFCHPDTTLTFEKYYLAPENDFRAVRYKSNLENAENALELREQGKTTTVNIDQAIINAYTYLEDRMLSEFEYAMFDQARLAAVVARSAAVWKLDIQEMQGLVEEEDYLIQLFEFYNKYKNIHDDVKELIDEELKDWLEEEYEVKLPPRSITLHLNGGSIYAKTRQEVVDMFLADMYEHLTNIGYEALPETLEEFKSEAGIAAFFTAANIATYFYEFIKDNSDALTVDETGEATQFIRQPEYNEKWLPLLYFLNDTTQIGHAGGRDILGRNGQEYEFKYIIPPSTHMSWGVIVNSQAGADTRVREYLTGKYAYAAYKEVIIEKMWLLSPEDSQAKIDAAELKYTAGQAKVEIEEVLKPGYTFEGWYLDEELTQKATMTPLGLGLADVELYAKWKAIEE